MKKILKWASQYQVFAFFVITYTLTWGLSFSYRAVLQQGRVLLLPLAFIATCGPGLAGIIVSIVANPKCRQGFRKEFLVAFAVAWLVAILVNLANQKFIENMSFSPGLVGLFVVSIIPVAFVIASSFSPNPLVRSYLSSLVKVRGVWRWTIFAFVMGFAFTLISIPIGSILRLRPVSSYQLPELSPTLIGLVIVKFLYQFLFFNATGEETGWRGFAMPRMQSKISPLLASIIIGVFWALWHLPLWQAEGRPVDSIEFWVEMLIAHILFSVITVWFCNRANGSIFVAGVAHATINTAQAFIPVGSPLLVTFAFVATGMIFLDRMWEKLPSDHPAVYNNLSIDI
jgi:membrane protease YdiL (CAAX protease family)